MKNDQTHSKKERKTFEKGTRPLITLFSRTNSRNYPVLVVPQILPDATEISLLAQLRQCGCRCIRIIRMPGTERTRTLGPGKECCLAIEPLNNNYSGCCFLAGSGRSQQEHEQIYSAPVQESVVILGYIFQRSGCVLEGIFQRQPFQEGIFQHNKSEGHSFFKDRRRCQ